MLCGGFNYFSKFRNEETKVQKDKIFPEVTKIVFMEMEFKWSRQNQTSYTLG